MKPYYRSKGITIYHGDCREVLPTLPKVDLVLTDPPYGIVLRNHDTTGQTSRVPIAISDYRVIGDSSSAVAEEFLEWAMDKACIAFASPKHPWPGKWRQWLVWDKGGAVGGGGDIATCWKFTWELIQVARTRRLNGRREASVLRFPITQGCFKHHPTEKPLPLISYLMQKASCDGDLVLDPFMGAGTTLLAARNLNRKAIGIELEEKYCEIAVKRLEGLPLKKAAA